MKRGKKNEKITLECNLPNSAHQPLNPPTPKLITLRTIQLERLHREKQTQVWCDKIRFFHHYYTVFLAQFDLVMSATTLLLNIALDY